MGPVIFLHSRGRSMSTFLGVAALSLMLVTFLGMVPPSNAKLLPREERKPPVASQSSGSASDREISSSGIENLGKMLRARSRMRSQGVTGALEMGMERFQELLFEPPRNYSAFVMFYSDHERCGACGEALAAWDSVTDAYMEAYYAEKYVEQLESEKGAVFFVKVRITGGYREILDLPTSIPSLFYFAPSASSKFNEFEQIDRKLLLREDGSLDMMQMLKWIQFLRRDMKFNMNREEFQSANALHLFAIGVAATISLFLTYYMGHLDVFMGWLKDFNYAYFLTIVVLWLLSGQMYNYIRGVATFGRGEVTSLSTFIYPGSRYQYGIESVIIMFLYALMVYGMIELIKAREIELEISPEESVTLTATPPEEIPRGRSENETQYAIMCAMSCMFFSFLALLVITNVKTHG